MKKKTTKASASRSSSRSSRKQSTNMVYAVIFLVVLLVAAVLVFMNMSKPNVTQSDAKAPAVEMQNPAGDIPFPSNEDMSGL